jgi:hypothetical protein
MTVPATIGSTPPKPFAEFRDRCVIGAECSPALGQRRLVERDRQIGLVKIDVRLGEVGTQGRGGASDSSGPTQV